jgi:hypothetical protein
MQFVSQKTSTLEGGIVALNKSAVSIQSFWRGNNLRKRLRFHMVCGSCDCPEVIINRQERDECLADNQKIWNHICKNCRASFDERDTTFDLCKRHLGLDGCEHCFSLDRMHQINMSLLHYSKTGSFYR